jgi:hypothetical protein
MFKYTNCIGDYERLFSFNTHPRFAEALSATYLDIIHICIDFKRSLQEQKASRLKRAFLPLSSSANAHFDDAVTRFRTHRKTVEKEADLCHMIEFKESREMVLREKIEAETRLQRKYSPSS